MGYYKHTQNVWSYCESLEFDTLSHWINTKIICSVEARPWFVVPWFGMSSYFTWTSVVPDMLAAPWRRIAWTLLFCIDWLCRYRRIGYVQCCQCARVNFNSLQWISRTIWIQTIPQDPLLIAPSSPSLGQSTIKICRCCNSATTLQRHTLQQPTIIERLPSKLLLKFRIRWDYECIIIQTRTMQLNCNSDTHLDWG